MNKLNLNPLTPAVFYTLLALATEERHGYGIMKQVKLDSNDSVKMGPGTLYGSIERMLKDKLIEEADARPAAKQDDERRKYYKITHLGKKHLKAELDRYAQAVGRAQQANILGLWETQNA
jgi:DNA-binding PadR family transcriptional regulator